MYLDVNFWRVHQENYTQVRGINIKEAIFKEGGDTFQNCSIHLSFYEKISNKDLLVPLDEQPKIFSMSLCQFNKDDTLKVPPTAYEIKIVLVLKDFTAQFVTKQQYHNFGTSNME